MLWASDRNPLGTSTGESFEVGLGGEVSMAVVLGHFFAAISVGGGVGYAFKGGDGAPSTFGGTALWDTAGRSNHLTAQVDLNLLRVGVTF
jgi:hypothetical protein